MKDIVCWRLFERFVGGAHENWLNKAEEMVGSRKRVLKTIKKDGVANILMAKRRCHFSFTHMPISRKVGGFVFELKKWRNVVIGTAWIILTAPEFSM